MPIELLTKAGFSLVAHESGKTYHFPYPAYIFLKNCPTFPTLVSCLKIPPLLFLFHIGSTSIIILIQTFPYLPQQN